MLLLLKPMDKEKSLYTNVFDKKNLAFDKKNLANITKITDKNKDIKISDIRQLNLKNEYTTSN